MLARLLMLIVFALTEAESMCRFRTALTMMGRRKQLQKGIKITASTVRRKLEDIMNVFPETNSANHFDPALIYRYAIYTSFTYFENSADIQRDSGVVLNGKLIYTGNFQLLQRRQLHGYSEKKLDALYTLVRNDQQKVIVLSWQGSNDVADYKADAEAVLQLQASDPQSSPFFNDARCKYSGSGDFRKEKAKVYLAKGFVKSLPQSNLDQIVRDLREAKANHVNYKIVITGHSLGGAKAYLTAMYLTLYHQEYLPLHAVYTYGQPTVGSNAYNDYIAKCIGPERIVRVVSSNDIIPWTNVGDKNRHSELVKEVFMPDPQRPGIVVCQGSRDMRCSAQTPCNEKSWENHSFFGGFPLFDAAKLLGQDGVYESNKKAKHPKAITKRNEH